MTDEEITARIEALELELKRRDVAEDPDRQAQVQEQIALYRGLQGSTGKRTRLRGEKA